MKEPTRLNVTSSLRSWLDRLWRYMRASRILNGPTYTVRRTPDGSVLLFDRARGGGGGTVPHILICYNGTQVYLDEIDV